MKLNRPARAGSYESNDLMVFLYPADERTIELESPIYPMYGKHIIGVIEEELAKAGLTHVKVHAIDKGALDYTIRARLQAAIKRGMSNGTD